MSGPAILSCTAGSPSSNRRLRYRIRLQRVDADDEASPAPIPEPTAAAGFAQDHLQKRVPVGTFGDARPPR